MLIAFGASRKDGKDLFTLYVPTPSKNLQAFDILCHNPYGKFGYLNFHRKLPITTKNVLNHNQCKQIKPRNVPESLSTSSCRKESLSFPSGPLRTAGARAVESVSSPAPSVVPPLVSVAGVFVLGADKDTYVC